MKTNYYIIGILLVLSSQFGFSQPWKTYPYTPTGSLISFPNDEGRHINEPVEWWYTTGHIVGNTSGTNYSYMLSYFYFPRNGFDGFRILNISNDATGEIFNETKLVNFTTLSTDKLNIEAAVFLGGTETWKNKTETNGDLIPFEYVINASSANTTLNLEYKALKPPLIIDGDGFFNQGGISYTYYYSQTKNNVTGTLTLNGVTETISGSSWIDRQYGNFNPFNRENYEWLSIQLSNGMDINLWNIFTNANTIPDQLEYRLLAAYVNDNTQYTNKDFQLERLTFDCSADGLKCYSQQWRLTSAINNLDLIITTLHHDSEVLLPFRFYEGATTITGTVNGVSVTGIGFAELLHSYDTPVLSITNPTGGAYNTTQPITWQVTNPDEGMPLKYAVDFSVDNQASFASIVQGITETSYTWTSPTVNNGDAIWFKIKGASIDDTIQGEVISSASADVTLSIDDNLANNAINIYPNPAIDKLVVQLSEYLPNISYQIIDFSGRILTEKKVTTSTAFEVDIRNLSSGIYFIKIRANNKKMVSKFMVK